MQQEELEAYLRKHTLNGQLQELHDAWMALCRAVVHDFARMGLKLLDMFGM